MSTSAAKIGFIGLGNMVCPRGCLLSSCQMALSALAPVNMFKLQRLLQQCGGCRNEANPR